jgi:hypothetical protein
MLLDVLLFSCKDGDSECLCLINNAAMDARSQLLSVNLANFCGELTSPPTLQTPTTFYNHGYLQSRSAGNYRRI